jgi:hypothetical protein
MRRAAAWTFDKHLRLQLVTPCLIEIKNNNHCDPLRAEGLKTSVGGFSIRSVWARVNLSDGCLLIEINRIATQSASNFVLREKIDANMIGLF